MTDRTEVHAWLRGYAACLDSAVPLLLSGQDPPDSFLDACQEFDAALRRLDARALADEMASPSGRELRQALEEARARFEMAVEDRKSQIRERLEDLVRSKTALRGYGDAAQHQHQGALYLEKRI